MRKSISEYIDAVGTEVALASRSFVPVFEGLELKTQPIPRPMGWARSVSHAPRQFLRGCLHVDQDLLCAGIAHAMAGRCDGTGVDGRCTIAVEHWNRNPMQGGPAVVASTASGIGDLAGVKGKKIGFSANGGLCELAWRDHLASVGVTIADVGPVVLPFPGQEAAMEQGNIDATCTINPFYSSMGGGKRGAGGGEAGGGHFGRAGDGLNIDPAGGKPAICRRNRRDWVFGPVSGGSHQF